MILQQGHAQVMEFSKCQLGNSIEISKKKVMQTLRSEMCLDVNTLVTLL